MAPMGVDFIAALLRAAAASGLICGGAPVVKNGTMKIIATIIARTIAKYFSGPSAALIRSSMPALCAVVMASSLFLMSVIHHWTSPALGSRLSTPR